MPAFIDLTGQRFGRLVVIGQAGRNRHGQMMWLCRCDCGKEVVVAGCNLRSGNTQSCGCLNRERVAAAQTAHGHARGGKMSRAYRCWDHIIQRCANPRHKYYANYGGRGIEVCERWREFKNFLEDMGEPPAEAQIDRIDNDGNYEPGNCRWATRGENQRNKRNNRRVTFRGKTQCLKAWSEELGIAANAIRKRLRRGWAVARALTEPVQKQKQKQNRECACTAVTPGARRRK